MMTDILVQNENAPASDLLRKAAGWKRVPAKPGQQSREDNQSQAQRNRRKKNGRPHANDVDAAMKIIEGTARSMGVTIE